MHRLRRINPSIEANLSHLSISYSGPPTAGSSAPAAAAAGSDTPAPDSPLGFLSALVDQLLAGTSATPDPTVPTTTADTGGAVPATPSPAATGVNGLFGLNPDASAQPVPPMTVALFGQLAKALKAIQSELDAGQKPTDAELKRLGHMADALASLVAAPQPQAAAPLPATSTPPDPGTTLDPLATIKAAAAPGPGASTPPDAPGAKPDDKPAGPNDQLSQLLASMGITLPLSPPSATPPVPDAPATTETAPAGAVTAPSAASTAPALPAIAQLVTKLTELSASIAPVAPDVARKLDALTQKLNTAETDPRTLAQLTGASDSTGDGLDKLVQQLLDAKPAPAPASPAPQLASTTKLDIPAPIAPQAPAVPSPDQPVAPQPAQQTAGVDPASALRPAASVTAPDPAPGDKSKPEAKVAATAAVIADSTRTDASDSTAQSAANAAAPVAQNAPTRAIPAAYQAASNPINMGQVAFEMARQMHQGQSRFTIRIDPPELGRVDVKMHVDTAGNVNARLTVERSETLDMFQRDRGSLERALGQAGLDAGKTNLEFSLKQNPFAGMTGGDQRQQGGGSGPRFSYKGDDDAIAAVPTVNLYRGTASAGGVNIFA